MITRVRLPSEDGFLEIANGDRDDLYKDPHQPTQPKCNCSCSNIFKLALSFGAIWAINQL